jgi:glycosyltransferase involved in cell wall biosynthesis
MYNDTLPIYYLYRKLKVEFVSACNYRRGKMKIVILTETFNKRMGYSENMLPRYLSRLGHEVHVVTSDLLPYQYRNKEMHTTYLEFNKESCLLPGTVEKHDGYKLHVLSHNKLFGYMRMAGLYKTLMDIRPTIVQVFTAISWIPLEAAINRPFIGYRLFTGSHTTASVFPAAYEKGYRLDWNTIKIMTTRAFHGRFISLQTDGCFCPTVDCADVATRFFGVEKKKVVMIPLGVDTVIFTPPKKQEDWTSRKEMRSKVGFKEEEIVCVYTGRFSQDKNPLLLAQSIETLYRKGLPFRGLFVGNGSQEKEIIKCKGCVVCPFVPHSELRKYYLSSDIGVWPTQESMSMIDAAACGIPIVVNDTMQATERVEGNGLKYRLNDKDDLMRVLNELQDKKKRRILGDNGANKALREFSWEAIARKHLACYEKALRERR